LSRIYHVISNVHPHSKMHMCTFCIPYENNSYFTAIMSACPQVKSFRILLEQSFTTRILLLMAASLLRFGIRCYSFSSVTCTISVLL